MLIIAVVVWLAAEKSTEPQFENKVDKLLFDTDNKSPKYIITLPDKTRRDFVEKNADNNEEKADKPSKAYKGDLSEEDIRLRELVNNTPNLSKLKDIVNPLPLKYIETDSALSMAEGEMTLPKISEDGRKPWIEYAAPAKTVQPIFADSRRCKKSGLVAGQPGLLLPNFQEKFPCLFLLTAMKIKN